MEAKFCVQLKTMNMARSYNNSTFIALIWIIIWTLYLLKTVAKTNYEKKSTKYSNLNSRGKKTKKQKKHPGISARGRSV